MPDHARSDDPAVQAQLDRFAQLSPGRDVLGLERITALLARLGDPHTRLPPVFHVAGTNGKGSTCAFLRACLEAAGLTVHVYTSPHLVRFNERIRLAGRLIDDAALAPLLAEVLDAAAGLSPSFFEATTAAALLAFARTPADACVVEVGLGGRLDATNVFAEPAVCGISQLGIDHQSFLGETLGEIAAEKAGIARRDVPLVTLAHAPEAMAAVEHVAAAVGALLLVEGRDWSIDPALLPALSGDHQRRNAGLAAAMLGAQTALAIPEQAIVTGIGQAKWPGRLQRLAPGPLADTLPSGSALWVDGAHNPAAATALADELRRRPMHLICGILANKDAGGILAHLAPTALSLTLVAVPGHACHDPAELAARFGGAAAANVPAALAALPQPGDVLVAGSLYLVGTVLAANGEAPD